jgi:hypothetical protein
LTETVQSNWLTETVQLNWHKSLLLCVCVCMLLFKVRNQPDSPTSCPTPLTIALCSFSVQVH